jgi:hypothetical protein
MTNKNVGDEGMQCKVGRNTVDEKLEASFLRWV